MAKYGNEKEIGQTLLKIKEELDARKAQRAELQGELNSLMKQLKDFGVGTLEQAEQRLQQQEEELEQLQQQIEEEITQLKEMMNDENN